MSTTELLTVALRPLLRNRALEIDWYVVTTAGTLRPDTVVIEVSGTTRRAHVQLTYGRELAEDVFIAWAGDHSTWQRRIRNLSGETIPLVELGVRLRNVSFGVPCEDDYFYHAENPRIYDRMTIPVRLKRTAEMAKSSEFDQLSGTRWADPGVVSDRVGASPYQPFPAVLLGNYQSALGLVHGTLSQRVFFHNYLFTHENNSVTWDILSSFKAVAWRDLAAGEIMDSDLAYMGVTDARDLETMFNGYTAVLRKHLPPMWGASPINRHSAVWGSWNDGICRDIDEASLLAQADFLRQNLPTVEWMQIDDGYATLAGPLECAHGLGAPYEGEGWVAAAKFPHGLKHFTDAVRQRGIKPAIWIGGKVPSGAPLVKDHPDWFVDYSYRMGDSAGILDVSLPQVRDYMQHALDVLLCESGFLGMKHDFWSYVFEDSHPLLARHDRSGYEWRTWWLREIRQRLPDYGYVQTGCDIVMGNPFLGEYFTNYRYGIDIGSGNWEHVRTNILWGTACFAMHVGDLIVPNSDSIGLLPGLTDAEAQSCITYCLVSRSMVEVAGWLYREPNHPRMRWVRKALCCPNNGQDVFFADYDYRLADAWAPPIWYLRTPHFSRLEDDIYLPMRTVAIFNLGDDEQEFSLTSTKLKLTEEEFWVTDIWSLETCSLADLRSIRLPGRSSRLFAINRTDDGPQVLDADVQILRTEKRGRTLWLELAHAGPMEIVLTRAPEAIQFSAAGEFQVHQGKGNWRVTGTPAAPGSLSLRF